MAAAKTKVSMRFREDDLTIIDRGAQLLGLSRTEFIRRAALHKAQAAILNETVIRVSPQANDAFMQAISSPAAASPPKGRPSGCAGPRPGTARWRFQASITLTRRTASTASIAARPRSTPGWQASCERTTPAGLPAS